MNEHYSNHVDDDSRSCVSWEVHLRVSNVKDKSKWTHIDTVKGLSRSPKSGITVWRAWIPTQAAMSIFAENRHEVRHIGRIVERPHMGQRAVPEGPRTRLSSSHMFADCLAESTQLKLSAEKQHILFPSLACILSQSHPGRMDGCSERKLGNMFKEAWDRQLQRLQRSAMPSVSGNVFSSQAVSGSACTSHPASFLSLTSTRHFLCGPGETRFVSLSIKQ